MLEIPQLRDLFRSLKKTTVDDVTDRINYFWTSNICLFFAIVTCSRMVFGRPIECRFPGEYTSPWVDYAHQYCYITTTYAKRANDSWPTDKVKSEASSSYYQWVPTILALQALFLYLPHFLWKFSQKYSNIEFEYVVTECKKLRYSVADDRDKGIVDIVDYLKMRLSYQKARNENVRFGHFNSLLYLCSKGLTIVVIIANIIFMNTVFGKGRTSFWGFNMVYNSFTNPSWEEFGVFPRITYCNFQQLSLMQNMQYRTAECVLILNILNEKIFIFLWIWFCFTLVISLVNLIQFVGIFLPFCRHRKADYYLRPHKFCNASDSSTGYEHFESNSYDIFADDTLGPDGLQLLDFIKEHAGGMVASQIACALLDNLKIRAPSSALSHDSGSLPRNNMYIINEKDFISKTGKSL